MLKNPKKADLDKDGKLSGYEKKRAKAIESNMKQKPIKAVLGIATMGLLGAKMLKDKKKKATASVAPGAKAASSATPMRSKLLQKAMDKAKADGILKTAKSGKMMKAKEGKMTSNRRKRLKDIQNPKSEYDEKGKLKYTAAKEGKMMKQGYGAARTSGMGLQDENLIPGKSLDYYKDVM